MHHHLAILEEEMATHSSILPGKISWTEEPGRLQSVGLQRVGHDRGTVHSKGDQSWVFSGRNDAKAETPVLGHLMQRDDHYIYYWGQESLRRNGVAITVNKRV